MKRIFFAAVVLVSSNLALALPQENNLPIKKVDSEETGLTLDAQEEAGAGFDLEEEDISTLDPQESNTSI
jgi:hypothetical protein